MNDMPPESKRDKLKYDKMNAQFNEWLQENWESLVYDYALRDGSGFEDWAWDKWNEEKEEDNPPYVAPDGSC